MAVTLGRYYVHRQLRCVLMSKFYCFWELHRNTNLNYFVFFTDGGQVVQDESVANMDVEMVSQEEEPEEQDTHRCAKCQMEFTSLQDYVQHKMTNHKLKVCPRHQIFFCKIK